MPDTIDPIASALGAIRQQLEDIKEDVGEIKLQTQKTNGRVTALETANEVKAGMDAQRRSMKNGVVGAATLFGTLFGGIAAVGFAHLIGAY